MRDLTPTYYFTDSAKQIYYCAHKYYHLGPTQINDLGPRNTLWQSNLYKNSNNNHTWQCRVVNPNGSYTNNVNYRNMFSFNPNNQTIWQVSFDFDSLGFPIMAYTVENYYDSQFEITYPQAYVVRYNLNNQNTEVIPLVRGAKWPQVNYVTDGKRGEIIITYLRNGKVYYCKQSDNYLFGKMLFQDPKKVAIWKSALEIRENQTSKYNVGYQIR